LWPDFSRIPSGDNPTVIFSPITPETPVELSGMRVTPVLVNHTIDAAGFLIETPSGAIGYSGDTGPTDRFWEVLDRTQNLKVLLQEISFPNEHHRLAKISGHHTPETLAKELLKLGSEIRDLPVMLYHIKPVFQERVERELAQIRRHNLQICQLGDQYLL